MKTSLYNQDESLCSEAQLLISPKPDGVSRTDWRKRKKEFKTLLSAEDAREFERIRKNKQTTRRRAENPEKVKAENAKCRAKNPEKAKQDSAKWRAENPVKSKQSSANWYAENTEKAKENNAKWRAENPEKAKQDNAKWRAENPEKKKAQDAKWRVQNPGYNAKWEKENPEKAKEGRARRKAKNRAKDPLFRLQCNMRSGCSRVVRQLSLGKKPASTFKWIGCSQEELKDHLESLFTEGMTWENYGKNGWHVDHIRPVCSFSTEEWEQVNHYTNLQPLWAEDNLTKSGFDRRQSVRSLNNTRAVETSINKH
jgi:hypothetical protein